MTNEELQEAIARADDEYDMLKDTCHDQYEKIKELEEIIDKIKKYINEEIEEYEKGQLLYKDFGRELEQYTKGQLVAYKHIEKLLKGENNE